jgi:RNA polymerase sigma-70 factor (ECF subfamily)
MQAEASIDPDHQQITELYGEHAARLRGTAARILGSLADAEDVVQDAFMRLHLAEGVSSSGKPAWLRTTVIRLSLMRLRSARRRRCRDDLTGWIHILSSTGPPDIIDAYVLDQAIRSLPDALRTVFVLHHVEGFTHAEISDCLAITPAASAKRLSRAVRWLRKRLGDT